MEILVERRWRKSEYIIGRFFIDGELICNSLEDRSRGLSSVMSEREILERKVFGETAIPVGRYEVDMRTVSPKFSQKAFYMQVCRGRVPRLKGVKGFSGILIHVADGARGAKLLHGCIAVGYNRIVGGLLDGKECFKRVYGILKEAHDRGEAIYITMTEP